MTTRYLAFDLGAESGRCVVGTLAGRRLELTEVHRFATPSLFCHGRWHWDVLAMFAEMEIALRKAVKAFGPAFRSLSVDSWGVDYVLLDADGRLLGYPYHYRDARTGGILEQAFAVLPKEEIYQATGSLFMEYNTLYQFLAESRQQTNLLDIAASMLPMANFFQFLFTGVQKAEYTAVSTTQMADPRTRQWAREVIDAFGYPRGIFPEIVEPGTVVGPLLPEIARRTGLDAGVQVVAGASHDTAAAVAAVPVQGGSHWAYLSAGTWSLLGAELAAPIISGQALRHNFTNEGGVEGTTRFLTNLTGLWPLQECRRQWQADGRDYSYDDLARLAEAAPASTAIVDFDQPRFLRPENMVQEIHACLRETGQPIPESVGGLVRCILASLADKYRRTLAALQEATGQTYEVLHVVGGGSRNALHCQLTADATGIEVLAGPAECTALGNIGMQAIALGDVANVQKLRNIVAESFPLKRYVPT